MKTGLTIRKIKLPDTQEVFVVTLRTHSVYLLMEGETPSLQSFCIIKAEIFLSGYFEPGARGFRYEA